MTATAPTAVVRSRDDTRTVEAWHATLERRMGVDQILAERPGP